VDATEQLVFDSRKAVFKCTVLYFILEVIIIVAGNVLAIFVLDLLGAIVIVICSLLTILGLVVTMYYQTLPLKMEVARYEALARKEEVD